MLQEVRLLYGTKNPVEVKISFELSKYQYRTVFSREVVTISRCRQSERMARG